MKAMDVANFYIQLANGLPGDSIDNLKLNKLLYFAQGRYLAVTGKPLFDDDIEAWEYGPVVGDIYRAFKVCGRNPIENGDVFDESTLSSEALDVLVDVYMNYGKYSGGALVQMTHEHGTPWSDVYVEGANNIISCDKMKKYFSSDTSFQPFEIDYANAEIVDVSEDCTYA